MAGRVCPVMMQAYSHPARHGNAWLREGMGLFRRAPITWASTMAIYIALVALVSRLLPELLPLPAPAVLILLTALNACFFVSFMTIAKTTHTEQVVTIPLLFSGFSTHVAGLLFVGFLEGALLFIVTEIWAAQNPALQGPVDATVLAQTIDMTFLLCLAVFIAIKILFVYAPGLIVFYGVPPVKAIVFSAIGATRNWRAWILYLVGLFVLITLPPLVLMMLISTFPNLQFFVFHIMLVCLVCIIFPIVYSSVYVSLVDVFRIEHRVSEVA